MEDLPKAPANFTAVSPLTFLYRAAQVYANRTSIIYGDVRFTWSQTMDRCRRLACSVKDYVARGDVVSVVAPNVPALLEMHFAVPMAGAILNTINTRLDARNVALILSHSHAKLLFVDHQFLPLAEQALTILSPETKPELVLIHDNPCHKTFGMATYEDLIRQGDPRFEALAPQDEWDSIALNYTSGTTSAPKGVVYSHPRGAYLSSLAILLLWQMGTEPVYLWTLPIFHCNGWTFTWALAARGGTSVCIRNTTASDIYLAIANEGVTHLCCAPIVFNIILNSESPTALPRPVHVLTGGAPPAPSVVMKMESMGFVVTHAYGLTEATGPALACEWKTEWNGLDETRRGDLKGRQGVGVLSLDSVDVKNTDTMASVPRDGKSVGEIMLRGSGLMKGYLHDPNSTSQAFSGGWFHTGDVGVVHPDGYVEIKDRSKDVIISGGENISSVEVECVLYTHPSVIEAAVVAMPHSYWGETPCAFVNTKEKIREEEFISFCRDKLPRYMVPKAVKFMELPKTSTGKIQKFLLRELAKKLSFNLSRKVSKARSSHRRTSSDDHGSNYVVARSRL